MRTAEQMFFIEEGDGLPDIHCDVDGWLRIGGLHDPGRFSIQFPSSYSLVEFAARLFREATKLDRSLVDAAMAEREEAIGER